MTDTPLRLAVLGATGRTGTPLVRQAITRGHVVTVLARDAAKADRLLPAEVATVVGDGADASAVARAVEGADVVLDVSGPVGQGHGIQVPRADLATALLDLAEAGTWPAGSPVVSS